VPKYTRPRRTWKYSHQFKRKAVVLSLQNDVFIKDVALSLDIHPFMLSRWRGEYRDGLLGRVSQKYLEMMDKQKHCNQKKLSETERLRVENERLRQENDLLKKWQRYLAEQHQHDLDSSKDTGN